MNLTKDQMAFIDAMMSRMNGAIDAACEAKLAARGALVPAASAAMLPGGPARPPLNPGPIPGPGCAPLQGIGAWCPLKIDDCLFSNLALDVELYSWPLVQNQLWDTDTKLNNIVVGGLPLVAGGSLTISQETDRTIGYVPSVVQIATTWSGGNPQPGLLTYQWQVAMQTSLTAGQVQFSNVQTGDQYECGDNCIQVPFPSYQGASGWPIGSLAALQLVVSLSAAATSQLDGISVKVYHRKSKNGNGACNLNGPTCGGCGGCG